MGQNLIDQSKKGSTFDEHQSIHLCPSPPPMMSSSHSFPSISSSSPPPSPPPKSPAGGNRPTMAAAATEGNKRPPFLTPPLALMGGLAAAVRPTNVARGLLGLFRNVLPGSDLSLVDLPPSFNLPKSQLQLYGESVYCAGDGEYLSKCNAGKSCLERFTAVLAWSISTTRPPISGLAPFNPVLGETHHASRGSLNVLLEQVSQNPPVSALHATDQKEKIEMVWSQCPVTRFTGTSVEASVAGLRRLNLLSFRESYEMTSPNLHVRLIPTPATSWSGSVKILCMDSGLGAQLVYGGRGSFLGFGGSSRAVRGKVFDLKSEEIIYEVDGHWDRTVRLTDARSGDTSVLYDASTAIANLKAPELVDARGVLATESAVVWSEVSSALVRRDFGGAREAKKRVLEEQSSRKRERKERGEVWTPKHFAVSEERGEWTCAPLKQFVPPAPIAVPL